MTWAENTARIEKMRKLYQVLVGITEKKTPFQRHRHRLG